MKIGFDFSGTLADDRRPVYTATAEVVKQFGGEVPDFDTWRVSGCANISEFVARYNMPLPSSEFSRLMRVAWPENCCIPPYEGIDRLLLTLKQQGHSLFLLSCCWQDVLDNAVKALGWTTFFDEIHGSLDGGANDLPRRFKDKREAISGLGLDVYVGDTLGDFRACAGITRFLPVVYGYGTQRQFTSAGLVEFASSPADILALLTSNRADQ